MVVGRSTGRFQCVRKVVREAIKQELVLAPTLSQEDWGDLAWGAKWKQENATNTHVSVSYYLRIYDYYTLEFT